MSSRKVVIYYSWSRPGETGAPLEVIENRFPALFESRRMLYPRFEDLSDPVRFDQGVAGFLDHIMKANFVAFRDQARAIGRPVVEVERIADNGVCTAIDSELLDGADTLIVIGFDSMRTGQTASANEVAALQAFLARPNNLAFICPHHDIGHASELAHDERVAVQTAAFLHHGDRTIPPEQRFGGLARSLLAGLGLPVENRHGLRPRAKGDGSPAAVEVETQADRLGLLGGVGGLNLHPHLPHFERLGDAVTKLSVLVRQPIDLAAPPHPFTKSGRSTFDAMLQSRPDVFAGDLLVGDATLWSSTAGGVGNLRQLWANVLARVDRQ
ncbi:MAG TPA: hypothetical protein VEH77_03545 [Roseiarcus sp.]|nr:hypothetical protein [Roseiarcus sp.]